jgi:radical SAM protein with 4Fe4S-binding SPASM domain
LNPETYDYLTGTSGRLSRVIDNIQQMAAKPREYRVVIVSVITGRNFNEASDLADFAVNVGADELRFLPLSGALAHIYPLDVVFQETPENLAVLANASAKVHEEHLVSRDVLSSGDRIEVVKKMMPTCPNPTNQFIFSMGGEVQPCCYIPIEEGFGNIFNTPWEELWNSEFYEQFRERVANGTCELCLKYCRNWG